MPHHVDPATHAAHDTVLVAAYAAGDATGAGLDHATALVAACPDCAVLHRDLRAIAAALPATPAPRRTRDFRLTPEQAASLRPAAWRRLLVPFAGPRFAFAAPLGSGLAALGIVGVLLAGPGVPMGGPTAAPQSAEEPFLAASPVAEDGTVRVTDLSGAETASGADKNAGPGNETPAEGVPGVLSPGEVAATAGESFRVQDEAVRDQSVVMPGNIVLVALAGALLVTGVTMAGLRVLARRIA